MKFGFRFFRWRVYVRVVQDEPYAWLRQMAEDAMIYGEGIVRVEPDDYRVKLRFP